MFGLQQQQDCRSNHGKGITAGLVTYLISVLWVFSVGQIPVLAASLEEDINTLEALAATHATELRQLRQNIPQAVDTRLAIFLTLASQNGLDLDSVELFVNGKPAVAHLYTPRESESLQQGAIQPLYTGNLVNGSHELKTVITARAANDRFVRRESSHRFEKRPGALRLEMALEARAPDYEPRVSFVEWK